MNRTPFASALVAAKWSENAFHTFDGFYVTPIKTRVKWALSPRGLRHRVVRVSAVWRGGEVAYGGQWLCGEWAGHVTLLPDDVNPGRTCERCELREQYPARPVVYRAFDAQDSLIYIGSTGDLGARVYSHRCSSPWFRRMARLEVESHPTLNAARAAEAAAIAAERPECNRQGKARLVGACS